MIHYKKENFERESGTTSKTTNNKYFENKEVKVNI